MSLQRGTGSGERAQGTTKYRMGTKPRFGMKLLIGLGFELGFVSIFHFPVPRIGSPLPVPRSSNIRKCLATEAQTCQLD